MKISKYDQLLKTCQPDIFPSGLLYKIRKYFIKREINHKILVNLKRTNDKILAYKRHSHKFKGANHAFTSN